MTDNPTYEQAIRVARDLIEPGENAEYERGMAELIADLWGEEGVLLGDRSIQVMHDILSIDPMAPANPEHVELRRRGDDVLNRIFTHDALHGVDSELPDALVSEWVSVHRATRRIPELQDLADELKAAVLKPTRRDA